jgi:hypothetical protein
VFIASAWPAALAAGSANAQLVVGVTVMRSCVVSAQPASETTSRLTLSCAAGALRGIQMNWSAATFDQRGDSTRLVAPTTPTSQATSHSDLRILTVNF